MKWIERKGQAKNNAKREVVEEISLNRNNCTFMDYVNIRRNKLEKIIRKNKQQN